MQAFFPELLDSFLDIKFIKKVCEKFHYEEINLSELQAVAGEMLPVMRSEAFWEVCAPWTWDCGEKTDAVYEGVVMTLGKGLDCLQESYHKKGMLTESYMLEALASELLLHGYKAYNRHVREAGGWHVARYHFPGSEKSLPLEMLPDMLSRFSVQVSCNRAFCIMPKKSVVFLAELTQDETVRCEGICVGCGNVRCSNRMEEDAQMERIMTDIPLTYGYQRIFGKGIPWAWGR
ncbi:MAG: hypothetical protein K2H41_01095 [Acetatifactor sp.]|nr:hypothetical protein [Acetatifactor sp.]